MSVFVQSDDFDVSAELAKIRQNKPEIGAIVSFVGVVRDFSDAASIQSMELEHYPGMTELALQKIIEKASARWKLIDTLVIHRIGVLQAMDQIVLVAVASKHRGEAFSACEFIMDYLKTQAPFWKKETTATEQRWVDARETDEHALAKWSTGLAS